MRQEEAAKWQNAIWFHAASVGEFEQARPIIEAIYASTAALKEQGTRTKDEKPKMILTFFSPSGYEMRKNYDKVDGVFYLPFATHRNAVEFLTLLKPKMAIFIKYEFWPAYLKELQRRAIPTYSVSAIFRENQLFFKPWGGAYRSLLHCFTKLFVQDETSKTLLAKFNIDDVEVTGDTRFDRVTEVASVPKELPLLEQFRVESVECREVESVKLKVLMAGSTWPEDEELLARYVREHEDVKLVLVPHEIDEEHLHRIFQIFQGEFVRYTQATPMNIQHTRVLVVDTMGLLSSLYRYADVAYIGGGFGVGIHNTLEAAV
ncbi:MAG: 3-deoxy-D-manno-octulosonic acid transferase, partial [Paludibacteraceae bacterium]|nr:3-deoxy-D-manno-octulosonic acid transferase [Paludibacteraceae bacterium]